MTDDAMLDALAAALAPRVAKLLREQGEQPPDDGLAELLERAGYELAAEEGGAQ